ncbi:Crp/Fnr family transcriptional regulator [Chitinophaga sp.]|uniref:Crp/Fnr family transcriptional regulator n=1 Tax=Chitinophaga sp. TaxID=1869181 RepID=UPI0031D1E022
MIQTNSALLQLINDMLPAAGGAITVRQFDAGQRFIFQGQEILQVYIIRAGVVKPLITEENGKEYILEFLGEGEMLGEVEAIRGTKTICSVDAVTPVSLYAMGVGQFHYFLQTIPAFNNLVMRLLATRVANSSVKMARQQLYTMAELLPQLQKMLAAQQIGFTKQDLAGYMGISVRSLNRLLKENS